MPILDWVDKDKALKAADGAPYRLLEEVPKLSFGDADHENMLIQGDNLDALKALIPYYAGRVKCIFIDPPYNTGSAFDHYDDNVEHSKWLSLIYPRVELLRDLLTEDGTIWITLDDRESHYFKVMCDELFGRKNFIANAIWEKSDSPRMDAVFFSSRHDHLLAYAKNKEFAEFNRLPAEIADHYNRVDDKGRRYYTKPLRAMGGQGDSREARPTLYYALEAPDGSKVYPVRQDGTDGAWRWREEKVRDESERIDWVNGKKGWVPYYRIYGDASQGRPAETIFPHSLAGSNRTSKSEIKKLFPVDNPFGTPKPESLIKCVLTIATNPGDLVLDSFLGSGTTAAVAHKMGRKYIGIELGDHAVTHCAPRMQKVIEGEPGGISKACKWEGGGGFRFFRLGEGVFDEAGQINPDIRFPVLAAHVWFSETHTPWTGKGKSPLLGVHNGVAYYLLYNGILGDRKPQNGNVLTSRILAELPPHDGPKVVYGEWTPFKADRLRKEDIVFKQTPYDVKAR